MTCSVCGGPVRNGAKYGICKRNSGCKKAGQAARYAATSDRVKALVAAYRASNPDKVRAQNASYYATNRDKVRNRQAVYYAATSDRVKVRGARWRAANPDKVKAQHAAYKAANPDKVRIQAAKYMASRYASDPTFRLKRLLRRGLQRIIKNTAKVSSYSDFLGCEAAEARDHIASKFRRGMSWENHGEWHIDHIIPLVTIKSYVDPATNRLALDENQMKVVLHYTNLQPLWAKENLSKGARLEPRPEAVQVLGQAGAAMVLQVAQAGQHGLLSHLPDAV